MNYIKHNIFKTIILVICLSLAVTTFANQKVKIGDTMVELPDYLTLNMCMKLAYLDQPYINLIDLQIERLELAIDEAFSEKKDTKMKEMHIKLQRLGLLKEKKRMVDTVRNIVTSYYLNYIVIHDSVRLTKKAYDISKRYQKHIKTLVSQGLATSTALFEAEKEVKASYASYIDMKIKKEQIISSLLLALNLDLDIRVEIDIKLPSYKGNLNRNKLLKKLYENNLELKFNELQLDTKKEELKIFKKTIVSKNQIKRKEYDIKEADINLDFKRKELKNELLTKYLDWKAAIAHLSKAKKQLESAKQTYKSAKGLKKAGLMKKIDLDRVKLGVDQARLAIKSAIVEIYIAEMNVDFLTRPLTDYDK